MKRMPLFAIVACAGLAPALIHAQEVTPGIQFTLEATGDSELRTVSYRCGADTALKVRYVNASPNFLAIVPVDGQSLVFVSVMSGSGARYAAGKHEWWTKGAEAVLRDITQDENAPPLLDCTETGS